MNGLKRNINTVWAREPFWGKYEELNDAIIPDLKMIQNFQIAKLQEFEKINADRRNEDFADLNSLFLEGSINSLPSNYKKDENEQLSKVLTQIVSHLNWTYKFSEGKEKYNYNGLQEPLKVLINDLERLNNIIISNGGQAIPDRYLDNLRSTLHSCQIGSLDNNNLTKWYKELNNFKGDLVEDIGVAWLSTLKIPNIMSLNTGALNYQGSGKFGRKGQLIQDIMILAVQSSDIEIKEIPIEYKNPKGNFVKSTIGQLLQDMEKANGQHKQIILDDNGYEVLLKLSALNFQAKAGLNQMLWNQSKSTQIKIGEFSEEDGLTISARRTFELLHSLDQDNIPQKDIWVKDSSKDYRMIADYGLATVMSKVLHLGKHGNDFVLTPEGFTSYSHRINTLMQKRKSRLTIRGNVTINDNTLGTPYNVGMTNY